MDPAALSVHFGGRLVKTLRPNRITYRTHYGFHMVFDALVDFDDGSGPQQLAGDWLWTGSPGQTISYASSGQPPTLHYQAALSGQQLEHWWAEGLWPSQPLPIHNRDAIRPLGDGFVASLVGDSALHTRLRRNRLEAVLLEIHRQQEQQPTLPSWVLQVQATLEANWNRPVDYQALSAMFRMSVHTLRHGFRAATGLAIHDWFLRKRHREAQRLLLESDRSIGAIANHCGFQDAGFFSKQFKRFVGMSPREYRSSVQG